MHRRKVGSGWTRRDVLKASAAGTGLLVLPGFVASCGKSIAPPPEVSSGFFAAYGIDADVIQKVLAASLSRGAEFADLYFQHTRTNYLILQDGEVNSAYCDVSLGCGVRVLKGDQTGFAFTEDLTPESLTTAAQTASVVADGTGTPSLATLQGVEPPSYYAIQIPWAEVGIDRKLPFLLTADQKARSVDNRIVKVRANLTDSTSHVLIATSEGKVVEDNRPMTTLSVSCVAEQENRRESNYYSLGRRMGFELYTDEQVNQVAQEAAERTALLFEAAPPPAGEYPVVLAPGLSGILLHEAMGHGFEADFNRKGTSIFADKMGTQIAPEFVTIVDDGTNPHLRGTLNVDDEGVESQRTVLVENGILKSYLHDRISAAHYGLAPTGNGRRESYQYPPVPRMRNTYMMAGPHDPEEIIKSVKKGLYAETFRNGQVDIGAGDFSFYLKDGYLIEDGKLTRPAKDANLIGFGPRVLELTDMVGTDMEFYSGTGMCGKDGQRVPVGFGLPTTRCGGVSVGGVG